MSPRQLQIKAVADLLDVVESMSSDEERSVGIKACLQLLDELTHEESDQAEINFLQGHAWYLSADSEQRTTKVLAFFSAALEMNFEHSRAKVYLCHHLFDIEDYSEFLKHYRQIDMQYLQGWRKLRFLEMNLLAKLHTGSITEAESDHYINAYENAEENQRPKIQALFDYSFSHESELTENLKKFIFKWANYWGLSYAYQD